jgi:hypothetical protein
MADGKAYPRIGKMRPMSDEHVEALKAGMATAVRIDVEISDDALKSINIARAEYLAAYEAARNHKLAADFDELARCCRQTAARIGQMLRGSTGDVIQSRLLVRDRIKIEGLVRHLNKVDLACQTLARDLADGEALDDEVKFPGIVHFCLSLRNVFDALCGDISYRGKKLKEQNRAIPFIQFLRLCLAGLPEENQPTEKALDSVVRRALGK